jgi:hypothetical protein
MTDTLFYPNSSNNMGKAIIILKRTRCYIDCEIYNYEYEDGCCVFDNQININKKRYRVAYPNTQNEMITLEDNPKSDFSLPIFDFHLKKSLTLEQAIEYHKYHEECGYKEDSYDYYFYYWYEIFGSDNINPNNVDASI